MNNLKFNIFILALTLVISSITSAQMMQQSILSEEFLASLPAGERSLMEGNNPAQEEEELEKLLRSDTSIEKNEAVLERLQQELKELESKMTFQSKRSK